MKTAVIYARYSSDRQTEQSIEGQVRVCNDYAERNDILIVNQYVDRATRQEGLGLCAGLQIGQILP